MALEMTISALALEPTEELRSRRRRLDRKLAKVPRLL
jgi:hypothetical protein